MIIDTFHPFNASTAGADVMLNGFGDAAEIEATRAGLERDCGVKAVAMPRPMPLVEPVITADLPARLMGILRSAGEGIIGRTLHRTIPLRRSGLQAFLGSRHLRRAFPHRLEGL